MFTWCRKQKASIILLQETHSTADKEKQWKAEWGAPIEFAHGSSSARGAAILLCNGFDCKIKRKIVDPMGRYIGIEAEIKDENYLLFNVYASNNDSQFGSGVNVMSVYFLLIILKDVRKLIGRKRKGCKRNIKMHKLILKKTHLSKPDRHWRNVRWG